jgi:tricarballylate dehydrogenase
VGCGITFTFGGLRIDTEARVLDADQRRSRASMPAGELVAAIFYFNYPAVGAHQRGGLRPAGGCDGGRRPQDQCGGWRC